MKDFPAGEKKRATKVLKSDKDTSSTATVLGVQKVAVLAPKIALRETSDEDLMRQVSSRVKLSLNVGYASVPPALPDIENRIRPCIPGKSGVGRARLIGLSPSNYSWDIQDFIESQALEGEDAADALNLLSAEYNVDGVNEQFATIMQGTYCTIGRASTRTQRLWSSIGLDPVAMGSTVGLIDCHVGGIQGSCSESAACIWFDATANEFRFSTDSDTDYVTLNGYEVFPDQGSKPLKNEDVCSVGPRVFVFLTS